MKYIDNIKSVADLKPDYLGFIFYEKSKRNFEGIIPELPKNIKKTGVFVNEAIEIIVSLTEEYQLQAIQLHGNESVEYIKELKNYLKKIEFIKAFSINDTFDFSILDPYKSEVDYFLFDTKGKEQGGNGIKFNWSILKNYSLSKPFFLSGGISSNDVDEIKKIKKTGLLIYGVDINSQFEIEPGLKKAAEIEQFKKKIVS